MLLESKNKLLMWYLKIRAQYYLFQSVSNSGNWMATVKSALYHPKKSAYCCKFDHPHILFSHKEENKFQLLITTPWPQHL